MKMSEFRELTKHVDGDAELEIEILSPEKPWSKMDKVQRYIFSHLSRIPVTKIRETFYDHKDNKAVKIS